VLAAAVILQSVATAPVFAPPLDTPLRVSIHRVESEDGVERSFAAERSVRFRRTGDALIAEVTFLSASAESPDARDAMFEAAYGALTGETITVRLDAQAHVVGIDDLDGVWRRFCRALADQVAATRGRGSDADRAKFAQGLFNGMMRWPEAQKLKTFGSLVADLAVAEPLPPPGSTRAIEVPGRTPGGDRVTLSGTLTASEQGGRLTVVLDARGSFTAPDAGLAVASQPVELHRREERVADPETGLILRSSETRTTVIGTGADRRTMTSRTSMTVDAQTP